MSDERPEETTTPEPDEERVQRFHAFMDELSAGVVESLDALEDSRPGWWQEAFRHLLYEGLCNLRDYLQNPDEGGTWDEPFVELQYPLQWNFNGPEEGRPVFVHVSIDEAEAAQQDDAARKELVQRLAREVAEVPRLRVLQDLTNHAGFIRYEDGTTCPLFPAGPGQEKDLRAQLEALSPEDRQAELDRLLRPFCIGPRKWWSRPTIEDLRETIAEAGGDPDTAASLSEADLDELDEMLWDEAAEESDEPGLVISLERGGRPLTVTVTAAIHPFIVDEAERRAYFPMVVGLIFAGEAGDPADWSEEDREAFWDLLLKGFRGAMAWEDDEGGEGFTSGDYEPPTGTQTVSEAALADRLVSRDELLRHRDRQASGEPAPERIGPPPPERRPPTLSFGTTKADVRALDFVAQLHHLRLPKRWSTIPRWEDLERSEIERLEEEFGETAFEDHRDRPALLSRRTARDGREQLQLTSESVRALRVREGLGSKGFREVDRRTGQEYLVRLVQAGSGYIEVGLSWWGQAGPLVESWVQDARKEADKIRRDTQQPVLFEDLEKERQTRLDAMLASIRCWDYGRKVLEAVLGQVGRQAQNPVVVPAEDLRLLLGLQEHRDWKDAVEGTLEGLRRLESRLRSFDLGHDLHGYGTALASWTYLGRGPGRHGDGDYYLELGRQFLGCLSVFESGGRKLRGGVEAATFNWSIKELPNETRAAVGWTRKSREEGETPERFVVFDAGTVFYNAAEGLTPEQGRLVKFLEQQETLQGDLPAKDPATGKAWTKRAKRGSAEAALPRLYDRRFCPLLPEGKSFHGALGHFPKNNPESGRTLRGTARRRGKTGGAHHDGLLAVMGYLLEPGRATEARRQTVEAALQDLRAVVVDYLGGIVAVLTADGSWISAEEAQRLPWDDMLKRTRWFLFLPQTWREDRVRRYQDRSGNLVTEDEAVARSNREARWSGDEDASSPVGGQVGLEGTPLYQRLHAGMKERGLSQKALAQLFGVSQPLVSLWFKGTAPDPTTGAVKGRPIPAEIRPLVERWLATGESPTNDELESLKSRRTGLRDE